MNLAHVVVEKNIKNVVENKKERVMTSKKSPIKKVEKIVVFLDICSSTKIVEDLLANENMEKWRSLIISLKEFLVEKNEDDFSFQIHKFLGDGWILLFPIKSEKEKLFVFLKKICEKYATIFKKKIEPVLSTDIDDTGITFGMDKGTLIRVIMNGRTEYLGRALNVASRLQSKVKGLDDSSPDGKVLMSNNIHSILDDDLKEKFDIEEKTVELKNISRGSKFRAKRMDLFSYKYKKKVTIIKSRKVRKKQFVPK